MKNITIPFVLIILVALAAVMFWPKTMTIDSTDKVHSDLYENAVGVWDAQLQVSTFELVPETQLTVQWEAPEQEYNHFVLSISDQDGQLLRKESGEHDRSSLDPDGLEPGGTYTFAIQACLDRECEEWLISEQEAQGTTMEMESDEPAEE